MQPPARFTPYKAIPAHFPTLWRAMGMVGTHDGKETGKGLCFHRSVALVLDCPLARLTIGTLRAATLEEQAAIPNASPVPFLHCWTEIGGFIFAPTTIEANGGLLAIPREVYYGKNGINTVTQMTRLKVRKLVEQNDWLAHITEGKRIARPLGDTLMDAAGVGYIITPQGTLLPT